MKRIPFSSFSSFSALFKDYTEHFERLAPFFAGDFRSDNDLKSVASAVAKNHPDRSVVVDAIRNQAAFYGLGEESEPLLEKLANPASVAIVTGQQLGLYGGPLYTLFKIITAIQLAARYERELGIPAVPVFWLEGEDHDFEEIASAAFLQGDDPIKVTYAPHLVALMRKAYAPGKTMLQAFVTVINAYVGEENVLFVSPDDAKLKAFSSDLFKRELNDFATSSELLSSTSEKLPEGHHVQVQTKPTNLFLHTENGRVAIDATETGFTTRDGRNLALGELEQLLSEDPGQFSPNVVLRPLMQDTVLPTAAYVAGPGEVAYFAQFKSLYTWAGLQMPIIYPRASATIMEKRIDKIVDKFSLSVPAFAEQFDRLFRQVVIDSSDVDVEGAFKASSTHLHKAINEIKPVVEQVDRSLVKSSDALRNEMMKEWNRLKDRVLKAERQQQDVVKGQLYRASSNLFPFEIPQERALSPLYFLNKYGPTFGQTLINTLDLDTTTHQVIEP